jgi:hypothetical protein
MVKNLKQIITEEINDFGWTKDIEPKIPFSSVNIGGWYDVELTDEFFNMVEGCGDRIDDFYDTTHVRVINKEVGVDYDFVYCESYSDEKIGTAILLEFYESDGNKFENNYWVTEDMTILSPRQNINESEEFNDFDWIKDVDISDYLEKPYFKNMKEYGLRPDEYPLVLSKLYNQPVTIKGRSLYNTNGNKIYSEYSTGYWEKYKHDSNGNIIYQEDSTGYWLKSEYDTNGNVIYFEDSNGRIIDNRNLNESNDFEWTKEIKPAKEQFPLEKGTLYYFEPNISMEKIKEVLIPKLKATRGMKSSVIKSLTKISETPRYQREGVKFFYTDDLSKEFNGWCSSSEIENYHWLAKVNGYEYFEISL